MTDHEKTLWLLSYAHAANTSIPPWQCVLYAANAVASFRLVTVDKEKHGAAADMLEEMRAPVFDIAKFAEIFNSRNTQSAVIPKYQKPSYAWRLDEIEAVSQKLASNIPVYVMYKDEQKLVTSINVHCIDIDHRKHVLDEINPLDIVK